MVRVRLRSVAAIGVAFSWVLTASAGAADFFQLAEELFGEQVVLGSTEDEPPALMAYADDEPLGYVFSTGAIVGSVGYSGKPFDIAVAMDMSATIVGARIISHSEPIFVIGVSDDDLADFLARLSGHDVRLPMAIRRGNSEGVDGIAGATISSQVMADAVLRSARAVAASRGLLGSAGMELDFSAYAPASWPDLLADGSLVERRITVGEVAAALAEKGGLLFAPGTPKPPDEALFITYYAALATPAQVGRNLFGEVADNGFRSDLGVDDQLLFIGADGLYSIKGTAWRRSGHFERVAVEQAGRSLALTAAAHRRVEGLVAADAPELRESALFVIPPDSGFDPALPWRLMLTLSGRGREDRASVVFALDYTLPARYRRAVVLDETPLWRRNWRERHLALALLAGVLLALSTILVLQDQVVRRRRLYRVLRLGFLVSTLVGLGWFLQAQLSVVNVLTFANAIMTGFHWQSFLIEPLIFVLWTYVAVVLLFWGRGVFCGWLCPFGALQELLNRMGRLARLPQIPIPFAVHERLWPIKYMIFLALFGLYLQFPDLALRGAEVEPFKTVIVLFFARAWPYVLFAIALLVLALFVNRVFCRYLCPLGAALAIPARMRMFEWLKRRWQCGAPCQRCAQTCPVEAIHPDGRINPNECIHCLRCQVLYFNDEVCPPLIERRKRRNKRNKERGQRADQISSTPG
jgi:transcriptional regulator of nitric oxide reductase